MKKTMFVLASVLSLASAFAANEQREGSLEVHALSFDDLRTACQNPARFHNQTAPTNIQISCKDVEYKWIPDGAGTIKMPSARNLTTTVYSDKYTVSPSTNGKSYSKSEPCAQFKQIAEVAETVRALSCDELIAFTGTADDLCLGTIDALKSANQNAVTVAATGQFFNLCEARKGQQGQK